MKSAHITNASRDMEYSPKREGIYFRRLTDSAPDKVDNAFASEVESETVHVTHSVLKLQESVDEAPEHRTDTELIPTLEYKPKVNLEDNDDLTLVVSNENIHAEKPVPDPNDTNGEMCINPERCI